MDAYKAGLAAASNGYGVYVVPGDDNEWIWVAGVYNTEDEALAVLQGGGLSDTCQVRPYTIQSKQFSVDGSVFTTCQQVLNTVQKVYDNLLSLRIAVDQNYEIHSLQIELTTQYNQIKDAAERLQTQNSKMKSDLLATLIYTANQNLLVLPEIISIDTKPSLAVINSALLKAIFSLDNF